MAATITDSTIHKKRKHQGTNAHSKANGTSTCLTTPLPHPSTGISFAPKRRRSRFTSKRTRKASPPPPRPVIVIDSASDDDTSDDAYPHVAPISPLFGSHPLPPPPKIGDPPRVYSSSSSSSPPIADEPDAESKHEAKDDAKDDFLSLQLQNQELNDSRARVFADFQLALLAKQKLNDIITLKDHQLKLKSLAEEKLAQELTAKAAVEEKLAQELILKSATEEKLAHQLNAALQTIADLQAKLPPPKPARKPRRLIPAQEKLNKLNKQLNPAWPNLINNLF